MRVSPSGVCPAGGIHWVFACGFDFGRGGCASWGGGGELVGCAESREFGASAHQLPRFVVLGNFSDTLLVVSILDMVYDFVSRFAVLKWLNSEHLF